MRILLINKFLYPKGGDAISTLATGRLLVEKGHSVVFWGMKYSANPAYPYSEYFVENIDYGRVLSIKQKLSISFKILYSFEAKRKIEKMVNIIKPDIVHLNNFAHQISPAILHVFKKYNIPTVMTMRDYKLVCPSYSMLSNGRPCQMCKNGKYYWCFFNKCSKGSYLKSLINAVEMYLHHKVLRIYDNISIYISPSRFLMNKVKEMGLKGEVMYLPNYVDASEYQPFYQWKEKSIVYFGRLSKEKGLIALLTAMKGLDIILKIIGDGAERDRLVKRAECEGLKNVVFLAYKTGKELCKEIAGSMFVILASEWYENNPRSVIEAFAMGKPVIGSRIGGIPELVIDGETGVTFAPGNAQDLRNKIEYLINKPDLVIEMGKKARKFAEEQFNPEKHYQELMKIYQMAMEKH